MPESIFNLMGMSSNGCMRVPEAQATPAVPALSIHSPQKRHPPRRKQPVAQTNRQAKATERHAARVRKASPRNGNDDALAELESKVSSKTNDTRKQRESRQCKTGQNKGRNRENCRSQASATESSRTSSSRGSALSSAGSRSISSEGYRQEQTQESSPQTKGQQRGYGKSSGGGACSFDWNNENVESKENQYQQQQQQGYGQQQQQQPGYHQHQQQQPGYQQQQQPAYNQNSGYQTTRSNAGGYQTNRSGGDDMVFGNRPGVSSNSYANGHHQNLGNAITDRSSTRRLAPPGGASQISFA